MRGFLDREKELDASQQIEESLTVRRQPLLLRRFVHVSFNNRSQLF